jgi:hypothetical protein
MGVIFAQVKEPMAQTLPGQQAEVDQVAEQICLSHDLGSYPAASAPNGLALRPLLRSLRGGGP